MDWDKDGELLAIVQHGSSAVTFWDKNSRKVNTLDSNMKESLSFCLWSKVGPQVR
jgi:WD repeat-containing protein 19